MILCYGLAQMIYRLFAIILLFQLCSLARASDEGFDLLDQVKSKLQQTIRAYDSKDQIRTREILKKLAQEAASFVSTPSPNDGVYRTPKQLSRYQTRSQIAFLAALLFIDGDQDVSFFSYELQTRQKKWKDSEQVKEQESGHLKSFWQKWAGYSVGFGLLGLFYGSTLQDYLAVGALSGSGLVVINHLRKEKKKAELEWQGAAGDYVIAESFHYTNNPELLQLIEQIRKDLKDYVFKEFKKEVEQLSFSQNQAPPVFGSFDDVFSFFNLQNNACEEVLTSSDLDAENEAQAAEETLNEKKKLYGYGF